MAMADASRYSSIAAALLGAWRVVQTVVEGTEEVREEGDEHFLWFTHEAIVTGDQWAAWDMPYSIRDYCVPMQIDIRRQDRGQPWLQLGIFEIADDTLRVCVAGAAANPRPSAPESTPTNGHILYTAKRCDEPLPS
jgi:uncharacterized protein (TIGR03067 family)